MINRAYRKLLWTAAVVAATFGTAATAQELTEAIYVPPSIDVPQISLDQALEIALNHDPDIYRGREDVRFQLGGAQEATGIFDESIVFSSEFNYSRGELLPGVANQQRGSRRLFRILSEVMQAVADDLQRELDENPASRVVLDCDRLAREGGENVLARGSEIVIRNPDTGEETIIRCATREEIAAGQQNAELLDQLIAAEQDPERRRELEALRASGIELSRDSITDVINILNGVAISQRESLSKIGPTSLIEERFTTTTSLGYRIPFRSGVVLTPLIGMSTLEENFLRKTHRPGFGGKPTKNTVRSFLGFQIEAPLGKGAGWLTATAPERAADLGYRASVMNFRQTTAESALRAALAYWDLVAAQQSLVFVRESAQRFLRFREIGQALVQADEVSRADLGHVEARISDLNVSVIGGEQAIINARVALAREIGLRIEEMADAPLASDPFPPIADPDRISVQDETPLLEIAYQNRTDLTAAEQRREASRILFDAAVANLRRRFDLSFTLGYQGIGEDPNYVLGIEHAFTGNYVGPSALLTLSVDYPFENNVAVGQLVQARSLTRQSDINRGNLQRTINSRVTQLLGDLREAASEVERHEVAAGYYRQSVGGETEKFRAGESTLVDVILTEEQLTSTELATVAARRTYASILAQLRFEMGVLVDFDNDTARVVPGSLSTLPF